MTIVIPSAENPQRFDFRKHPTARDVCLSAIRYLARAPGTCAAADGTCLNRGNMGHIIAPKADSPRACIFGAFLPDALWDELDNDEAMSAARSDLRKLAAGKYDEFDGDPRPVDLAKEFVKWLFLKDQLLNELQHAHDRDSNWGDSGFNDDGWEELWKVCRRRKISRKLFDATREAA